MAENQCQEGGEWWENALTVFLCVAVIGSYIPQHYRMIVEKRSEGFSPWFLLLGSTSGASSVLNLLSLQWDVLRCCRVVSSGACLELFGGIIQFTLIWACFSFILVLYMLYFPPHLKYVELDVDPEQTGLSRPLHVRTRARTDEWHTSVVLAWVVLGHLGFCTFITVLLIATGTPEQRSVWATFLGLSSAITATIQYIPQLMYTWRARVVGALSMPTMAIQTPGAAVMVLSIALRPGTNWTSWATPAVAGVMQGALLGICVAWKLRQSRLGIDDFGTPLAPARLRTLSSASSSSPALPDAGVPVTRGPGTPGVSVARALAVAEADDIRVRTPTPAAARADADGDGGEDEESPLLGPGERQDGSGAKAARKSGGWASWFGR